MTPRCPRRLNKLPCPGVGEPAPNIYVANSMWCSVCGQVFVLMRGR